ncbi:APC family permease [Labilibaculum sp. K2S]|uniref:APC family permease n=1 Tax=Labilibaculum sp. K2S TaxID=3056386 RepID=UPI0025A44590|nr:APC family permease [Labilibaculum sp. K2S]MDM8160435.1 APC family permease [Labilibaculum sp. K2S]
MTKENKKMSFNATWSMAVGGMVGGGIFSVLGVIIGIAGQWAWLSFVLAGLIALISAFSYSQLAIKYKKSGGAFTFLNEINHQGIAGSLSWVLILGYILTISVYAFTFGHYVAHVFNFGSWFPRVLAFTIIAVLALVNLRGVGDSSRVEIITVWGKLFVLLGLSIFGIVQWSPEQLTAGIEPKSWSAAIIGAATIFMAFEGFQLLSYDYEDIKNPTKTLPRATISAVIAVICIYVLVALGSTMLVGAETLIQEKEVALSIAGKQALGITGLVLVTIAAAFSTGSAINATLFSTGRLMETVAKKKDLPHLFVKENQANIPYYAIIIMAGLAAVLATIGSLSTLVDAASLIFLITFSVVNYISYQQKMKYRILSLIGSIACLIAILLSSYKQFQERPIPLIIILVFIFLALIGRPFILRKMNN